MRAFSLIGLHVFFAFLYYFRYFVFVHLLLFFVLAQFMLRLKTFSLGLFSDLVTVRGAFCFFVFFFVFSVIAFLRLSAA